MPNEIKFCLPVGEYYFLSPLSAFPIKMVVDGQEYVFPTVEHYYQAMKFYANDSRFCNILKLENPDDARLLTKTPEYKVNRRTGFDDMKFDIMEQGLRAKFTQNQDAAKLLLTTGDAILVKSCAVCYKCGFGRGGNNRMGQMLMQIRDELKRAIH
ncbi:MAG: NADAR family protein [Alphaproteobacteria bacterium]|nr:NADAR family protein [Alphaproteobacteria bacterium]MBR4806286.1 NADAR family protein [Alphaproteobacteria bacterium]